MTCKCIIIDRFSGDSAQQRFSSAKSISSDQYFGRDSGGSLVSVWWAYVCVGVVDP